MKTLKSKKIKNLFLALGFGACLGLSACATNYDYQYDKYDYQYEEKLNHKNVVIDEDTYTFTYSSDDLVDYDYWKNVFDILVSSSFTSSSNVVSASGSIFYNYNGTPTTYTLTGIWANTSNNNLIFTKQGSGPAQYIALDIPNETCTATPSSLTIISEDYYNLLFPYDDMPQVLNDFITILVGSIQNMATGIATGVASMASALFLNVNSSTGAVEGLSVFGGILAIFCGLALAIGITTRVYLWITRLGK